MAKLVDGSYICILEHFSIFNTKNISKIKEKLIQMSAIPLSPPSLRAESLYQCRRAHSGHRSLEGRRPLTSQGDGLPCQRSQKHQNSLHVCTAICTQLHIAALQRQTLCLGRYIYLTSLLSEILRVSLQ